MNKLKEIITELKEWAKEHPLTFMFTGFLVMFIVIIFKDEIKYSIKSNSSLVVGFVSPEKKVKILGPKEVTDTLKVKPKLIVNKIGLNWKETVRINGICEELREKYGAYYVNLNNFHNGDSSAGGWHYSKMTCIGEGLSENCIGQLGKLKNWHTGPFSEKFLKANKEHYLYLPDVTKDKHPYFSKTIPRFGVYSVVYIPILDYRYVDSDGLFKMEGFLSFGYNKPTDLKMKEIKAMMKEHYLVRKYVIKN